MDLAWDRREFHQLDILRNRSPARKRIGELLVEAGIVSPEKIPEGLKVVRQTGLPLGRVLIMLGVLKELDLDSALLLQNMLREGSLPSDGNLALRALKLAYQRQIPAEEALKALGWQKPMETLSVNELGELLVLAGAISRAQLTDALRKTASGGMPIGRFLVLQGGLSPSVLAAALSAQVLIRDDKVTKEQAVHGLKLALLRRATVEQALTYQGALEAPKKDRIKLGELLGSAAVVMECDALTAVELGLQKEEPMGSILVQAGIMAPQVLDAALKLQEMVSCGVISSLQAVEVMKQIHTRGIPAQQALEESGLLRVQEGKITQALDLLKMSGLLSEGQINQAKAAGSSGIGLRGALLTAKLLDEKLLEAAVSCSNLIQEGMLKIEQGIIALNYCARSRISLADAFEELVWDIPVTRPGA